MPIPPSVLLRRASIVLAALLIAGCATTQGLVGSVDAPRFVVGDHWQYRVTDNLRRGALAELDVEVIALNAGNATLRLVYTDSSGRTERTETIDPTGGLRVGALANGPSRAFSPPMKLFDFPLTASKTWRQTIPTLRRDLELKDSILVYGDVQGRAPVTVPAGSFDTVAVYSIVQLDDSEFWRSRTTRRDQVRYAAEVKGVVREVRDAEYVEIPAGPDAATIRTENTTTELVSFRPGL